MQNSDLQNVTVVLRKVTDKGTQVFLEDEKGDFYSFFKTKKDGTPTAAQLSFHFNVGEMVAITYKDVPYNGKTLRSVVKFKTPDERDRNSTPSNSSVPTYQNVQRSGNGFVAPATNRDEMIGVLALIKSTNITLEQLQDASVWQKFFKAYRLGVVVSQTVSVQPDNSTQADDINVDGIDF